MAWHRSSSPNSKKSPSLLSVESADKVLAKALGVLESCAASKRTVRGNIIVILQNKGLKLEITPENGATNAANCVTQLRRDSINESTARSSRVSTLSFTYKYLPHTRSGSKRHHNGSGPLMQDANLCVSIAT